MAKVGLDNSAVARGAGIQIMYAKQFTGSSAHEDVLI